VSLHTIRTLVLDLVILGGLAAGGWFIGAELLAHEAGPASPINVVAEVEGGQTSDGTLVVPLSGLSPFGQNSGLEGRQVLVGRVREVGEGFFVADTAIGPARFTFADDSSFLLRLTSGGPADLQPGAAIAVLAVSSGDGSFEASSVLVLPLDSRPSIQPPPPPPPPPAEGDDDAGEEEPEADDEDEEPG
jgi:hypothetical protein